MAAMPMLTLYEGDDEPEGQHQLVGGDLQNPHACCGACHYSPGSHIAHLEKMAKAEEQFKERKEKRGSQNDVHRHTCGD